MFRRIRGLFLQEYYITKGSFETLADIFWFPLMSTIVFGFIANYLAGIGGGHFPQQLMLGYILWEAFRTAQYSVSLNAMWNIWSHNLTNMFISPLSLNEYLMSQLISSYVRSAIILFLNGLILFFIFNFNILDIGLLNLVAHYTNLSIFAWSIAIVLLGVIFSVGTKIQALSWGFIYLFQPLTASLFPVAVLPEPLKTLSQFFPATYVFEAARGNVIDPSFNTHYFLMALGGNIVYFIGAYFIFKRLTLRSRQTGQFIKNDLQ